VRKPVRRGTVLNYVFLVSLLLVGLAIVGVFIDIPFISKYAFWVAISAYLSLASPPAACNLATLMIAAVQPSQLFEFGF
jgi:hypothetical protein